MSPENIDITHSIAAALYLVLDTKDYAKVFTESAGHNFHNREDAQRLLKNSEILSEYQRSAIFAYLYLYVRLQNKDIGALQPVRNVLAIPKGILKNLDLTINSERIDYIRALFGKRKREFVELFVEPDDFIVKIIEDAVSAETPEEKKKLSGLQSSEYEHESEKAALEELKSQKTLSGLVKWFNDYAYEKMEIVRLTGSGFLVTATNLPYVYGALQEVCRVLSIHKAPQLYLTSGGIGAYTVGTKTPIICLSSGSLSLLTYDELLFVLGHEAGHIKSGHFLYHSMANHLAVIGEMAGNMTMGIGSFLTKPLELALLAWYRKSELTADRAGLLACQNPEAAYSLFTKLSGYPLKYYRSINPKDILSQARTFEDLDSESYNKFAKFFNLMYASHPWTIMRAKELDKWVESGRYRGLINQKAILGTTYADCGGGSDIVSAGLQSNKPDSAVNRSASGISINVKSHNKPDFTGDSSDSVVRPEKSDTDSGKGSTGIDIGFRSNKPDANADKGKTGISISLKPDSSTAADPRSKPAGIRIQFKK